MARAPPGVRGSAGDGDGPRVGACGVTKALRGRCSSVKALPNHALTARHGAEGRYPRRGSSTPCGAGVGDAKAQQCVSAGWSRAGRRATTEYVESAATEVGDGLTAMPLVFPAARANGRRRTWDSGIALDGARARRFTQAMAIPGLRARPAPWRSAVGWYLRVRPRPRCKVSG